jgi:hypothetical protein
VAARKRSAPLSASATALALGAAAFLLLDRAAPADPVRAGREAFALALVPATLLLPALALLAAGLLRRRPGPEGGEELTEVRPALLGRVAVLLGVFGLIAVISVSRAGIGEFVGLAPRYTTLTVLRAGPAFMSWPCAPSTIPRRAGIVEWWSLGLALICLPGNVAMARAKGEERRLLQEGLLSRVRAAHPDRCAVGRLRPGTWPTGPRRSRWRSRRCAPSAPPLRRRPDDPGRRGHRCASTQRRRA